MIDAGKFIYNQVDFNSVDRSVWGVLKTEEKTEPGEEIKGGAEVEAEPTLHHHSPPDRTTEKDVARQAGDMDCYRIYFRSIGLIVFSTFLVLLFIQTGLSKLPRKSMHYATS
jgi:ATP-binding cassette, subfamily C (CFTR/MRP), member 1